MLVVVRHPHRAGNVLYLKTERESSEFFNLIKAASNGDNTFVLAGDGTLQMYKVGKAGLERVPEYFFSVKNSFFRWGRGVCAHDSPGISCSRKRAS